MICENLIKIIDQTEQHSKGERIVDTDPQKLANAFCVIRKLENKIIIIYNTDIEQRSYCVILCFECVHLTLNGLAECQKLIGNTSNIYILNTNAKEHRNADTLSPLETQRMKEHMSVKYSNQRKNSERSDECIDFTIIITSRNNASISNLGGGFRWQSEYPWCIIKYKYLIKNMACMQNINFEKSLAIVGFVIKKRRNSNTSTLKNRLFFRFTDDFLRSSKKLRRHFFEHWARSSSSQMIF
ncbi:hypothetical protein AGLY_003506 [Aphis glycines]|uniref:Uncharacterized protein n=1 Tax=Aphis glycines TaxID=307491 RepID=A0A6G0U179_APHGL|nr:hypothetical protein AGLY_003506 [Aphis glycines]